MVDDRFVQASPSIDSDHPAVRAYARAHAVGATHQERVVALYYAVRDGFRYNAWGVQFERSAFRASAVLQRDPARGAHCIDKALVLAAGARAIGVPARLHFANVRNHIGTAALEQRLGTNLLVFHGYVGLYLDGRWVAATPAFNRELCAHLGVDPLEFDGTFDSVFQAYDDQAGQFMEYVTDHGHHADIPFETMYEQWNEHYGINADTGWVMPSEG